MADRASTSNPMRGILFMVVAMLIFSAQDGLSKQLASTHSPIFITMIRYWFFGAVVLVILYRKGVRLGLSSGQPRLQIFRGVLLAIEICVAVAAFHLHGCESPLSLLLVRSWSSRCQARCWASQWVGVDGWLSPSVWSGC